jgi:hypothetical protein
LTGGYEAEGLQIPATVGQRLLWLMGRYRGGNGAMNCPILYRVCGRLDGPALSATLAELTRRHEGLRTTLSGRASRLVQHVHEPRAVPVRHVDLRAADGMGEGAWRALLDELRDEIPLGSWPMRVTLYRTAEDEYILCIVAQHYVTDGWSNTVLREELWNLYGQIVRGTEISLPPVAWQYQDFAAWQADRNGGPAWRDHESYWRRRLECVRIPRLPDSVEMTRATGISPGRPLGSDRPGGNDRGPAGHTGVEKFLVPEASVSALERLAGQERATLFTAALAVYYLWLHRVTGETDLAVGSMFANRLRHEAVGSVGFFANLLVLRTEIPQAGTFRDLLRATRDTVNGALDHQEVPYQMVRLSPSPHRSVRPEDLMFQMQPWPLDEHRSLPGAEAWQIPPPEGVATRFAFEFFMCPAGDGGLLGLIMFAQERFGRSWVRRAAADFEALAVQVATAPQTPLAG